LEQERGNDEIIADNIDAAASAPEAVASPAAVVSAPAATVHTASQRLPRNGRSVRVGILAAERSMEASPSASSYLIATSLMYGFGIYSPVALLSGAAETGDSSSEQSTSATAPCGMTELSTPLSTAGAESVVPASLFPGWEIEP